MPQYPTGGREHLPHPDKFVPTANTPKEKVTDWHTEHGSKALGGLAKNFIRQGPQHRYAGDMEDTNKQKSL